MSYDSHSGERRLFPDKENDLPEWDKLTRDERIVIGREGYDCLVMGKRNPVFSDLYRTWKSAMNKKYRIAAAHLMLDCFDDDFLDSISGPFDLKGLRRYKSRKTKR